MAKQSIIPFGPQHPVLPEPIHLDLVLEDEKVVEAIPSIGFVHRGLESLVDKKDFNEMTYVIERTCGICSFMHGMGYCESIEKIMNVEVPNRGKYLRTIWAEMSRVHSHLLWLGLLADAVVLPLHHQEFGRLAVDSLVVLATPHRHQVVLLAMDDAHRSLVCLCRAVDVQLLCAQQILAAQLHHLEAAHIFGRVGRVEPCVKQSAMPTSILQHRCRSQ